MRFNLIGNNWRDVARAATVEITDEHEAIASLIAFRIYGSKLTDLEGATMDGCRDLATDIMDLFHVKRP